MDVLLLHRGNDSEVGSLSGLRLSLQGDTTFSATFQAEASRPNMFTSKKVVLPTHGRRIWTLNDAALCVDQLEARLCTPRTGSHGTFVASIGRFLFLQDTESDEPPLARFDATAAAAAARAAAASVGAASEEKESMLSLFGIDWSARGDAHALDGAGEPDADGTAVGSASSTGSTGDDEAASGIEEEDAKGDEEEEGKTGSSEPAARFLHSIVVDQLRLLLTLELRNSLFEVGDSYYNFVLAEMPQLFERRVEASRPSPSAVSPTAALSPVDEASAIPPRIAAEGGLGSPARHRRSSSVGSPSLVGVDGMAELFLSGDASHSWHAAGDRRASASEAKLPPLPPPRSRSSSSSGDAGSSSDGKNAEDEAPLWLNLFLLQLRQPQINLQDDSAAGCAVITLELAQVEGRLDSSETQELDVRVDAVQLFTAPTDVDVGAGVPWLPYTRPGSPAASVPAGSGAPAGGASAGAAGGGPSGGHHRRSRSGGMSSVWGILKPVMDRCPLTCNVIVQRKLDADLLAALEAGQVSVSVEVQLPALRMYLSAPQARILSAVVMNILSPPMPTVVARERRRHEALLMAMLEERPRSIEEELAEKKRLRWAAAAAQNDLMEAKRREFSTAELRRTVDSLQRELADCRVRLRLLQQSAAAAASVRRIALPNIDVAILLDGVKLELRQEGASICSAAVSGIQLLLASYDGGAGELSVIVAAISVRNNLPRAPYVDVLGRYTTPAAGGRRSREDAPLVQVEARLAEPVGGITVVKHFELITQPLQLQLSYDLLLALMKFFAPLLGGDDADGGEEARRDAFLAPERGKRRSILAALSPSGDRRRSSAAAASAAATAAVSAVTTAAEKAVDVGSWSAAAAAPAAAAAAGGSASRRGSGDEEKTAADSDDGTMATMKRRAARTIVFKHVRLGEVSLVASYKGNKLNNVEDFERFTFKLHTLTYTSRTCSLQAFMDRLLRDIIVDILSQAGRNFKNLGLYMRDRMRLSRWLRSSDLRALFPMLGEGDSPAAVAGGVEEQEEASEEGAATAAEDAADDEESEDGKVAASDEGKRRDGEEEDDEDDGGGGGEERRSRDRLKQSLGRLFGIRKASSGERDDEEEERQSRERLMRGRRRWRLFKRRR
eukprot:PLAT12287.1.p1 GENE.PLAT12287.1~~PLAT12287.1.p1  ORF type:complete len:1284 (+),score=545.64 PLAT12287.1:483-3854(+)